MARKSMLKPARASRFQNFPNRRYRLLVHMSENGSGVPDPNELLVEQAQPFCGRPSEEFPEKSRH